MLRAIYGEASRFDKHTGTLIGGDWTCDRCHAEVRTHGSGLRLPPGWADVYFSHRFNEEDQLRHLCPACSAVLDDWLQGAGRET